MTVKPVETARFLGIWLDRRLRWIGHLQALRKKLAVQTFALTRLTATTWGCKVARARQLYTAIIRSTIAYGAGVWHQEDQSEEPKPKGLASKLGTTQSKALRVILGAYRDTPVRSLETSAQIPPLDLYHTAQKAAFEQRLEASGVAAYIR